VGEELDIWLAHRGAQTAHARPDCVHLTGRGGHFGNPIQKRAQLVMDGEEAWVAFPIVHGAWGRVVTRKARLCSRCGREARMGGPSSMTEVTGGAD